jgi:hypothetical protein
MPSDPRTRPTLVQRTRAVIFEMLGHQCALAEVDGESCDGPLEIDHPHGRDWQPRKVSSYNRNRRYLREAQDGLVRLLCRHHNASVKPRPRVEGAEQPF